MFPDAIHYHVRSEGQIIKKKDQKALMADLKAVYAAVDGPAALDAPDTFPERWGRKYPKISRSWRDDRADLYYQHR